MSTWSTTGERAAHSTSHEVSLSLTFAPLLLSFVTVHFSVSISHWSSFLDWTGLRCWDNVKQITQEGGVVVTQTGFHPSLLSPTFNLLSLLFLIPLYSHLSHSLARYLAPKGWEGSRPTVITTISSTPRTHSASHPTEKTRSS